jgi:hypothetical protein
MTRSRPEPSSTHTRRTRLALRACLAAVVLASSGIASRAIIIDLTLVRAHHAARAEHGDQAALLALVQSGEIEEAFELAFDTGDELFEVDFNAIDGVGANVGRGLRFSRVPRADLGGDGEWKHHIPPRTTGPNASACNQCHSLPADDGAGTAASNVHRDPTHGGGMDAIIVRNTPSLFGSGALQRLAEEMTATLTRTRDAVAEKACHTGATASADLVAKGVTFGTIRATRTGAAQCDVTFDTSGVTGVASDLVVRPYQWKGSIATLRAFNRDAGHNELGMQAVELTGDGVDGDYDGVTDELTVGDLTTLTIYLAAQPRPTTKTELAALGLIPRLAREEAQAIQRGAVAFREVGCANCHRTQLRIDDPVFREPSASADYRDGTFPGGQDPVARGLDPAFPVSFDLTKDQPDNRILDDDGNIVYRLGSFRADASGGAVVELLGDLKRHDMGPGLAEGIDEVGTGAATFMTENLWGVASTAPYLHDGRATTLTEAILEHGGEAQAARDSFLALVDASQKDVLAYLGNQVIFKMEEEEE